MHITVTTGRRIGHVIIRTHRERKIVSSTLLGMRSRSCESVRYRLPHALATSVGRGKLCERHVLVKSFGAGGGIGLIVISLSGNFQ